MSTSFDPCDVHEVYSAELPDGRPPLTATVTGTGPATEVVLTGTATRDMILGVLRRKTGAATTPRNMAMWSGKPVDEVKAELARLQAEGIAGPLPSRRGRERIWLLAEDL